MSQLRREALRAFKKLHRTRQFVFQGDELTLKAGRKEINEQFRKNRSEKNEDEIKKMIQLAHDVDNELRTSVIQAIQEKEGVYKLRITEETTRLDNVVFNPDAVIEKPASRNLKGNSMGDCCGGQSTAKN
ncbi:PREDICTED: complex III assembly factor LYRM7 [Bactrocera latifrons]|uniref:Complex III assembly factor LYRM7 n=1 Tax=Bactrocera latifrons TaxID=174628 RepID=A0A0K8VI95_BACLA|nr:PREDICTED: complex III assembly factor LYRM7 [Bactrocera latifrons]XP_018805060.1 PREDICTED: complex III assembly factor LYRM7 [Bactrocera latifrons]